VQRDDENLAQWHSRFNTLLDDAGPYASGIKNDPKALAAMWLKQLKPEYRAWASGKSFDTLSQAFEAARDVENNLHASIPVLDGFVPIKPVVTAQKDGTINVVHSFRPASAPEADKCQHCGRTNHSTDECWKCSNCGQHGHKDSRCRARNSRNDRHQPQQHGARFTRHRDRTPTASRSQSEKDVKKDENDLFQLPRSKLVEMIEELRKNGARGGQ